jgi:hypothetical protein
LRLCFYSGVIHSLDKQRHDTDAIFLEVSPVRSKSILAVDGLRVLQVVVKAELNNSTKLLGTDIESDDDVRVHGVKVERG